MKTYTYSADDKDYLYRRGFELAMAFYRNRIEFCYKDCMLRERLYDATIEGLRGAVNSFKPNFGTFEGYLFLLMRRRCTEQQRYVKWKTKPLSLSHSTLTSNAPLDTVLGRDDNAISIIEAREFITSRLHRLKPQYRIAIEMRLKSATMKEIAAVLKTSISRVHTLLQASYTILREDTEHV